MNRIDARYMNGQLFTKRTWQEGPVTVLWGQDEWVEPTKPPGSLGAPPKLPRVRGWLMRRTGWQMWRLDIRVTPPAGVDLETFGTKLLAQIPGGIRCPPIEEGNKAIWLVCGGWALDAGGALKQGEKVFDWMTGVDIATAQLRVQRTARS